MTARGKASDIDVWCRYDKLIDITDCIPNPRNPNTHPDKQIALLAKIIRSQGWRAPVTISNLSGFIVKGHGRLQAAQLIGVEQIPVEYQDYPNDAAEWQDLIADNRIAELAEPDNVMMKDILQELDDGATDMDLTGFDAEEMERLMTQFHTPDFEPVGEDEQSRLDQKKPIKCPECGHEFTT